MACAQALRDVRNHPTLAPLADRGLILSGDSSGANLALSVAVSNPGACAALLLFYGVFDSRLHRPSFQRFGKPPFLLSPDRMKMFWDHYCDPDLRLHPDAAPVLHEQQALAALPPVHLTIAGSDVLLDENIEMARHIADAGVSITTNLVERAPHGFIEAIGQSRLADTAMAVAAAWVRGQTA
jgi:acetyl esterase